MVDTDKLPPSRLLPYKTEENLHVRSPHHQRSELWCISEKGSFMCRKVARKCTSSKSGIKLIKLKWDDMSFCEAADGLESALPATAGATACPPGALCCAVVGNGLGDLPFGVRGILRSSSKSWPVQIPMDFMQVLSSNIYIYI